MKRPPRALTVPPRTTPAPPPPADLYVEPDTDIELLGEMLHDVKTMGQLLAELPFDRDGYRANLRIVAGAAVRMRARCARLLGDPPPDPMVSVDRLADAIVREVDRDEAENPEPPAAEPSNKIDAGAEAAAEAFYAPMAEVAIVHPDGETHQVPIQTSGSTRKNGSDSPKKTGFAYTAVETFVMTELRDRGTATTKELITAVANEHRIDQKAVDDALAHLRSTGRIKTTRLGRGLLNRIAEGVGA